MDVGGKVCHNLNSWTEENKCWVFLLSNLFKKMFGTDLLTYYFEKDIELKLMITKH